MAEIGLRRIAPMQLLVVAGLTRSFQTSGGGSRPESAASARHHHHSSDTRQVELNSKLTRSVDTCALVQELPRRPSGADSLMMEEQKRRFSEAGVNRRPSAAHILTEVSCLLKTRIQDEGQDLVSSEYHSKVSHGVILVKSSKQDVTL